MEDLLTDTLQQLLKDQCTPQRVREIEAGQSPAAFWVALEESGFADALVPEAQGGAGLALATVFPLLELCGNFAVPVPLAQTMLARALLAEADVARPAGSISLAPVAARDGAELRCPLVPFGHVADWVLACVDGSSVLLPVAQARMTAGVFPLDATLEWREADFVQARRVPGSHDLEALSAHFGLPVQRGRLPCPQRGKRFLRGQRHTRRDAPPNPLFLWT